MNWRSLLAVLATLGLASVVMAQRPEGGRGGFGGGGFGGGGFGGGGFGGGPPGGFSRGGRGGDFGDRGGRGGDRGGRGGDSGGRGGFDPADMVKRFDRNGNGTIEPDEAQGPAQFFLQRLAQSNPKIDLSKPVAVDTIVQEFEKMRGGGDSSRGSSGRGGSSSNEPELLVPDFSLGYEPQPVPGFGASAALYSVRVEDRDLKEAEERMRRYDRNRDGQLDAEELRRGRWSDDPMQYDRNGDGKLSKSELALRYANQRVAEDEQRSGGGNDWRSQSRWGRGGGNDGENNGWRRSDDSEEEVAGKEARFGDAKSYRLAGVGEKVTGKGLPDFFNQRDANGDGQVLMSEYSSSWDAETLAEFQRWDVNKDGIIVASECLFVLKNGAPVKSSSGSSGSSPSVARSSSKSSSGEVSQAYLDQAEKIMSRYDTNRDGQLTVDEWSKMLIKPDGADADGDGIITLMEYAKYRALK